MYFSCLNSRAIHFEVANSLGTGSFIHVLIRFISNRSIAPEYIHSDNGTNLISANRELRNIVNEWNQKQITDAMCKRGINWHFDPPS